MHYAKSYPKKTKKAYFLGGKLVVSKVKRLYFTSQPPNPARFCFKLNISHIFFIVKQKVKNFQRQS